MEEKKVEVLVEVPAEAPAEVPAAEMTLAQWAVEKKITLAEQHHMLDVAKGLKAKPASFDELLAITRKSRI